MGTTEDLRQRERESVRGEGEGWALVRLDCVEEESHHCGAAVN